MKPKIDRIIMALTKNKNYTGFWNYTSKIWKNKFNVIPTLFFYGTQEELDNLNLSKDHGEIYLLERCNEVTASTKLEWPCTWGLFYGASKFPNDVCMLSGIDQIPLNTYFFKKWQEIENVIEKYVVGFADAYGDPENLPNTVYYPSSHHIAKGNKFKEIYSIDNDWFSELKKIYSLRNSYYIPNPDYWGLDEAYSASVIKKRRKDNFDIHFMKIFQSYWTAHRLDRSNMNGFMNVNLDDIKNEKYCEFHAARPFESNNEKLMNEIYEKISLMEW